MTRQEFVDELAGMLELPGEAIQDGKFLAELEGWNSMSAIGFIALADAVAGIAIVPAELAQCKTVGDLGKLLHIEG